MEGIIPALGLRSKIPSASATVIAVCGITTESVLRTTSSLIFGKEFKQLIETEALEFRIACEDKYTTSLELSKTFWEPNVLTENPDEAVRDADVVILAADTVATIRQNLLSFQAVKHSIERHARRTVVVVSHGMSAHEQGAFKYLFPSWNVIPIPANGLAAVSSILGLMSGGSIRALPEDDDATLDLGSRDEAGVGMDSLCEFHTLSLRNR